MGYILIQSINESHEIILSDRFSDSVDWNDDLTAFLPGDLIKLSLDIEPEIAEEYKTRNHSDIKILPKPQTQEGGPVNFEVEIDFRITKRTHHIMRDWMTNYKMGFRSSGTTIWAEAVTHDGEDLLIELQKLFDANLEKKLYE